MGPTRRLLWGIFAFGAVIVIGVIGYSIIEGWPFSDSLYMTIITITTVGYSEVHPLSTGGRIFSIFLIVGGVGGALYALTGIIRYIVEGQFGITLGRRRMQARIAKMKGHFILCGFGGVGEEIANTFKDEKVPFVVIDNSSDRIARAEQAGYLYLQGDATSDETLKEAGIKQARGLVAAVGTDAGNTYITLSARGLCPNLFIEARASSEEAETKLKRAGADRVVSPNTIGARRMAMLVLRPAVVDFIDTLTLGRGREMQLENIIIGKDSRLIGLTIKKARSETGITTLAMQKKSGRPLFNPSEEEVIEENDLLIVIGTQKQLAVLEEALKAPEAS